MRAIGGYPELEVSDTGKHFHRTALRLNTGRNCLEYILRSKKFKKIYVPVYTCEAIYEPFQKLGVSLAEYRINAKLELAENIRLKDGEALLYTNYFGLKGDYISKIAKIYHGQLILDYTQAFYDKPIKGIPTFYSARKFFGVSDGAYLYNTPSLDETFQLDKSSERMIYLIERLESGPESGYNDFKKAEQSLCNQPIQMMSLFTDRILRTVDYSKAKLNRKRNFNLLHEILKSTNRLNIPVSDQIIVPMCYPYWSNDANLRKKLIATKVYIPCYWPNVLQNASIKSIEYDLAQTLCPLPILGSYSDMERIIETITNA